MKRISDEYMKKPKFGEKDPKHADPGLFTPECLMAYLDMSMKFNQDEILQQHLVAILSTARYYFEHIISCSYALLKCAEACLGMR